MNGPRPKLILLNGPPGSGKSTLAARYADDHPLALNLDVDRIRGMLGRWRDTPDEAGLAARAITLVAAQTHLAAGHDVVIPQLVAEPSFLEQLDGLSERVGVGFVELVLLDTKENTRLRFVRRNVESSDPAHREAAEMLAESGGVSRLDLYYDALVALVAMRPHARVVSTRYGEVERVYAAALAEINPVSVRDTPINPSCLTS